MEFDPFKLHSKGLNHDEIAKVKKIIDKAQAKKTRKTKILEKMSCWVILGITAIGNIIVSFMIIPYLVFLGNYTLYIILVIIGAALGIMFSQVLKSLEVEIGHHALMLLIIPTSAFVSFFIITSASNEIAKSYNIHSSHNPAIVGFFYIIIFLLPYLYFLFSKYIKNHPHHKFLEKR